MSGFQMLGVMQVKISTELGAENSIPGVALLDLFDSVELLKEFKADNKHPVYLLKGVFRSLKEFQAFSKNESLEILKIYEFNDVSAIFSARMTGPLPQIMSMFDDVWPTSPSLLNSDELILTLQGNSAGLAKARKQLIELFGDTFKISVNNNFQVSGIRLQDFLEGGKRFLKLLSRWVTTMHLVNVVKETSQILLASSKVQLQSIFKSLNR